MSAVIEMPRSTRIAIWGSVIAAITVTVLTTPFPPEGDAWRNAAYALLGVSVVGWVVWLRVDHAHPGWGLGAIVLFTFAGAALTGITFPGPAVALPGIGCARLGQRLAIRDSVAATGAAIAIVVGTALLRTRG